MDSAPVSRQSQLLARVRLTALPPLSLYVHIPWCVRKCPYCDFNSHELKEFSHSRPFPGEGVPRVLSQELEDRYVAALIADLEAALPSIWGRKVHTVFFGGGTPSLLSGAALDAILVAIRARVLLVPDAEITLEANPGTFEAQKFRDFRAAGVNRLSIGIQSFNPQHLKALGRIHDDVEARRAIENAQASFDNVNLDLMYGLPEQTLEEARSDIETAASFGTTHLSAYHLTLEPNTYFHRYPPRLPSDELAADMQVMAEEVVAARGYEHYETSAFAKPHRRCRHNLNYWQFGDYLGIGAGAHNKISFADRIVREMRFRQPKAYMDAALAGDAIQEHREVAPGDLPFEFMMNALRLIDGFPLRLFEERTGLPLTTGLPALNEAQSRGLLARDHERAAPTQLGQRFLNDLLQLFLPR